MAFILAGLVFVVTIAISGLMLFASGMSDSPSASAEMGGQIMWVFIGGTAISALIAASHWINIGW